MNCLLVIDVQKGFMYDRFNWLPSKIDEFISKSSFDFVGFSRCVNTAKSPKSEQLGWNKMISPEETKLMLSSKPDMIFDRNNYSSVNNLLKELISIEKIRVIFLCGINIDSSILATAIELFDLNVTPVILEDLCVSTKGDEYKDFSISLLKNLIGSSQIRTTSDLEDRR